MKKKAVLIISNDPKNKGYEPCFIDGEGKVINELKQPVKVIHVQV